MIDANRLTGLKAAKLNELTVAIEDVQYKLTIAAARTARGELYPQPFGPLATDIDRLAAQLNLIDILLWEAKK